MADNAKPMPQAAETIQLDPVAVVNEMGGYLETRARANAMVEDYLWTRVRLLATDKRTLEAANRDMAGQVTAAQQKFDALQAKVDAALKPSPVSQFINSSGEIGRVSVEPSETTFSTADPRLTSGG